MPRWVSGAGPLLGGRHSIGGEPLTLRLLRRGDERVWLNLRARERERLQPWEATPPGGPAPSVSFGQYVRAERRAVAAREALPLVVEWERALVGRVTVHRIEWGAECGASLGYWVAREWTGRGIAPRAVALAADHAFRQGIHRLEIAVRPENTASLRVVDKLGFRDEGLRRGYLFIDGAWRDHRVFALTAGEERTGEFWPAHP